MKKILFQAENKNFDMVCEALDRIITEDFKQVSYEEPTPTKEAAVFSNGSQTLLVETVTEYDCFYDKDFYSLKITDITEA